MDFIFNDFFVIISSNNKEAADFKSKKSFFRMKHAIVSP
jgi:hypothetical protein